VERALCYNRAVSVVLVDEGAEPGGHLVVEGGTTARPPWSTVPLGGVTEVAGFLLSASWGRTVSRRPLSWARHWPS
jgi:hypothetical protein